MPDLIVYGEVERKESYYVGDEAGALIRSDVTFTADRIIKGQSPRTIVLTILGGEIGRDGMLVSGVPRMEVGHHYLLFLAPREEWPTRIIVQYQFIADERYLRLVGEGLLQSLWAELCAAHPEGIGRNARIPVSELLSLSMPEWLRGP